MDIDLVENFEKLVARFDFEKVNTLMNFLSWRWCLNGNFIVPNIDEMKVTCFDLFYDALRTYELTKKTCSCNTGGFEVIIEEGGCILLKFVVEECEFNPSLESLS